LNTGTTIETSRLGALGVSTWFRIGDILSGKLKGVRDWTSESDLILGALHARAAVAVADSCRRVREIKDSG
jgi:hypothetical protein